MASHAPPGPLSRFAADLPPGLIAGAAGMAAALAVLLTIGDWTIAGAFLATALLVGGVLVLARRLFPSGARTTDDEADWTVARTLAADGADAVAVTDRSGRLVLANPAYQALMGGLPTPPSLPVGEPGVAALGTAGRTAWRDGRGTAAGLLAGGVPLTAQVARVGGEEAALVWRFIRADAHDPVQIVEAALAGAAGDRVGAAGVMLASLNADGRIRAVNRVFRFRAAGYDAAAIEGRSFEEFLASDPEGLTRFAREGGDGNPLRVVQLPLGEGDDRPMLVAVLDEETPAAPAAGGAAAIHALVSLLPLAIALVDREGRIAKMNDAFLRAAGVDPMRPPLYPGDLVVREDKAALADAVRRFAGGAGQAADLAVRLACDPDEPTTLSLASARGLGDAAVLIALRDAGEASNLKRQVAQASKMQAVGQLAGGIAHDFNNLLTAIIGHCDLMLMRHTPGDSDYDDIQQILINSNRAAAMTRQLLAFSRQQTLRPQVLQLPDVISEISNLLKRLLGETVRLEVRHGRNLGPVRADPGQLEQVIVNLAVNARDAMLSANPTGGGTLTIQTRSVSAADVTRMADDVLPVGDYTALSVSDTGTGIKPADLPKIFEPFFTTKEVGKGTGLGLSTVYGIVKQSGGYIFAESPPGQGATFTIFLPVHAAATGEARPQRKPKAKSGELWGSGTVLLVEDEAMVRSVAERALTRQGYTVMTAENGEAALEQLLAGPAPDLLISDVVMPSMDGPTMVRQARQMLPNLPVLFMSGYAEEQLRKSIDIDNVAFLPKPFSVQQLAEAARDVLESK